MAAIRSNLAWFSGPESGTLAMCSPEEAALLRLEEVFSATLARINSFVLQPLLEAGELRGGWGMQEPS